MVMQHAREFNVPVYLYYRPLLSMILSTEVYSEQFYVGFITFLKFFRIIEALHSETHRVVRFEGQESED